MRYHNITTDDMLNGDGLRTVLWVAGCNHHCEGCQNPITWDINGGIPFDEDAENELFQKLAPDYISGLTFSGGDPLHPQNRAEITRLAKKSRELFPKKDIWLYTGYTFDEVKELEIMQYIDVIVDGEFKKELLDEKLHWKGSANQRVIEVPETLKVGRIVLFDD
ncbi:MAG: anaerobic ribonucleoside-triphosphate reductase activating protein [[Eubacterium] saphenum]|nr:anaerobic ribonucleoside-triphosphate reductase activating protein [[Eubacterium] saphenum]